MAIWRVDSAATTEWAPSTAYSLGARVCCRSTYATQARRKWVWEGTTAGTSGSSEPTWPDGPVGQTVDDGTVQWTCRLPNDGIWANAYRYLCWALQYGAAAGDTIFVDDGHYENKQWSAHVYMYGGAEPTPKYIICVDKATDYLSVGALIEVQTVYEFVFLDFAYSYGVRYQAYGATFGSSTYQSGWLIEYDGGSANAFYINGGNLSVGSSTSYPASFELVSANLFLGGNSRFRFNGAGRFSWKRGKLTGIVSQCPYTLLKIYASGCYMRFEDIDLKDLDNYSSGGGFLLEATTTHQVIEAIFKRCKLQSSNFNWINGSMAVVGKTHIKLHHCSSGDRYFDLWEWGGEGTVEDETTIVRTGGASDGVTPLALKMVSSNCVVDNYCSLVSLPIHRWNDLAAEKTFTVEGIWDSAVNIQNDEIWMELEYPANAADGLGALHRTKCAPLGTPADVPASTSEWTTTGMSNPNKFKFQATVTPGKGGPVTARIYLAKPSTTVYIDPMITVS